MTSHTETTQQITETINSMDYNTGYQYSVTGSGITANGNLSPGTGTNNVTIDGVTYNMDRSNIQTDLSHKQHQEQRFSSQKRIKVLV